MKSLARSYIWWPGIDQEIEATTKSCDGCQRMKVNQQLVPVHPWEYPEGPWRRIHVDYAGPFESHRFLVVVDAFSKWLEVVVMKDSDALHTIEALREMFSRWGIPRQLVTDNGPQFVSNMFQRFMKSNGIKHVLSAPYHPATNGLAERFVQTMKQALKASKKDGNVTQTQRMGRFLLSYRNARHETTNTSPAELMLGRTLWTRLSLIQPDVMGRVLNKQAEQASIQGRLGKDQFEEGDMVVVRDYRLGQEKWQPGIVAQKKGTRSYEVKVNKW